MFRIIAFLPKKAYIVWFSPKRNAEREEQKGRENFLQFPPLIELKA